MTNESIDQILDHEFSHDFTEKMQNRMVFSFYKYGAIKDGFPDKLDALASLKARLERYVITGNTEYLVDAANFAMIEFMLPKHKNAHFEAKDSHDSPGRVTVDGVTTDKPNL